MEVLNTVLVSQARTGSKRLPGKVLLKVNNEELLKIHLNRLSKSKNIDKVIVATTFNDIDNLLCDLCMNWGYEVYRGEEFDVLDRFYNAVKKYNPQWVVRVTSDCPLIDSDIIDSVISCAKVNNVDYCSNGLIQNFPDGQDVEVMKFSALEKAWTYAKLKSEREHVTSYIVNRTKFRGEEVFMSVNFPCAFDFSMIRMTVDEDKDFNLINRLITDLGTNKSWLEYTNYILNTELNKINGDIIRNEGYLNSLKND